jgi:DNA-binding SARP family transcriptional activator
VTSVERRTALTRAAADLARGHTHAAIQRLRSLLVTDPTDLVIRARLAQAYRQAGNLVEAGRWAYLTDELRPNEEAAFLRAYPSSWLRLRALRYPADPQTLAPEPAARLRRLVIAAHLAGPPRLPAAPPRPPEKRHGTLFPCLYVVVILTAATVLAVIGAVRVWTWFIDL